MTDAADWTILRGKQSTRSQPMSEEELQAFLKQAQHNAELQEKLKAAKSNEEVLAIAKSAGFMISTEDPKQAQSEISENDLEGLAGGFTSTVDAAPCVVAPPVVYNPGF